MDLGHCLICYSSTTELLGASRSSNSPFEQDNFPHYSFILTKLLDIPINCLETYNLPKLEKSGRPNNLWMHLCQQCDGMVGEATTIYNQLLVLTRQLKLVQKAIVETITNSFNVEPFPVEPCITDMCRKCFIEVASQRCNEIPGRFVVEELLPLDEQVAIKEEIIDSYDDTVEKLLFALDEVESKITKEPGDTDNSTRVLKLSQDGKGINPKEELDTNADPQFSEMESDDDDNDDEESDWEPEPKSKSRTPARAPMRKRSSRNTPNTITKVTDGIRKRPGRPRKKEVVVKPPKKPLPDLHPKLNVMKANDGKFHCNEVACEKIYTKKFSLINHIRVKHLGETLYNCEFEGCGRTFTQATAFQVHKDRHNKTPRYKCDQCDLTFYSRNPFIRHQETIHEEGLQKKPFVCEKCGRTFSCRDHLYAHRISVHRNQSTGQIDNRIVCNLCGKLILATSLPVHIKNIHEKRPGKHPCHLCERRFHGPRHLKTHLFHHHHVGPKEYAIQKPKGDVHQCPIVGCKAKFFGKEFYDIHMKEVHGEDGKKPGAFRCKFCGKDYYIKTKLKHHEMVHQNLETRPFKCDICEKGFPSPTYLRFHKIHTHKLKLEDRRIVNNRKSTGTESSAVSSTDNTFN